MTSESAGLHGPVHLDDRLIVWLRDCEQAVAQALAGDRQLSSDLLQLLRDLAGGFELVQLVANVLADDVDDEAGMQRVLDELCRVQDWTAGRVWSVTDDDTPSLFATSITSGIAPSAASPSAIAVEALASDNHILRAAGRAEPVALAVPIVVDGSARYVLELDGDGWLRDDDVVIAAVRSVCATAGQWIALRDADRRARSGMSLQGRRAGDPPTVLVAALEHAVAAGELRLVYQPKISLLTNRVVGAEALLRWQSPERGLVMPDQFIPAAEQSGVIVPIGAWVLREAFRQASAWHAAYPRSPLQIAVNVSARQFRTGLARTIREAVESSSINATTVCLEMTESTIMDDITETVAVLDELKQLGFTLSVDDFGTGYSSLEYLHRMPIDEVKIDKSFVAGLGVDPMNTAIVASVISLAHAMNLEVVAEGVETLEQLEHLRTLGCDYAQGHLIARPLTPADADEFLAADATGQALPHADPTGGVVRPTVPETVLVVDDTADIRLLASMSLTAAGFTVEEAGNGAAAIALARRLGPDCVLLDVSMPDMSGIDVCRALRADPATADCTIVMLTTNADAADKAEAFLVGADDYIVKPFAPRDLVTRIHAAMRRRKTTIGTVGRQVDSALLEMLHSARERDAADGVLSEAEQLSSRQIEIVKRLLGGERVPTIARELFVSQSTVRNHLSAIYQRVGVHSQEELLSLLRKQSGERSSR